MSEKAWVGDSGFIIGFPSTMDFSVFTQCRLVIARPDSTNTYFDFDPAQFQSVGNGGLLNYEVRPGDITTAGNYKFQVYAKDATRDLSLGDSWMLEVEDRLTSNVWA